MSEYESLTFEKLQDRAMKLADQLVRQEFNLTSEAVLNGHQWAWRNGAYIGALTVLVELVDKGVNA